MKIEGAVKQESLRCSLDIGGANTHHVCVVADLASNRARRGGPRLHGSCLELGRAAPGDVVGRCVAAQPVADCKGGREREEEAHKARAGE